MTCVFTIIAVHFLGENHFTSLLIDDAFSFSFSHGLLPFFFEDENGLFSTVLIDISGSSLL